MNNNYFHQSKIINKKIINSELCFVEFKVENWNSHVPGQYSEICLTADNGYQAIRPYSIASEPNSNYVRFLIEKISNGEVSTFFFDHSMIGDKVLISRPIGLRFILRNESLPIFICSGSGIAPFLSMTKFLDYEKKNYKLFHWSKTFDGLVNYSDFSKQNNSEYHPFVTREKSGINGIGTERISKKDFNELDELLKYEIYICGSDYFVENASEIVQKIFLNSKIYTERFGS